MRRLAAGLAALLGGAAAAEPLQLQAHHQEPRAYGYQVGEVLQRVVLIDVPDGLALDEASLPRPGGRGQAIELRRVQWRSEPQRGGQRQTLQLHYQVFLAPREVRTLEIAPITLRYNGAMAGGAARQHSLRIDAWPVTVAPLLPLAVSPRRGLGDLQPDVPPPAIDTAAIRQRLQAWAVVALLLGGWLAAVRWAWPAWQRRHRPFGRAWVQLRELPDGPDGARWHEACRTLHRALDETVGAVLFEAGLADWIARRPAWAPLQADLALFLQRSRETFFAVGAEPVHDGAWLRALARRCCEVEREL